MTETADGLTIRPRPLPPAGHAFDSYDDHRMVMAAAVLGLGVPGIEVLNVATVGKTFPDFTGRWAALVRGEEPLRQRASLPRRGRRPGPRGPRLQAAHPAPPRARVGARGHSWSASTAAATAACSTTDDADDARLVTAMKARELGKGSVVVGDRVALAGDVSGRPGSLARIVRVEERTSVLRRSPDDTDPLERVVVANADQMVIVAALADPEPKTRFIDRCLVAAYDAGLEPLLVLTKSDLAAPRKLRAFYRPLGRPHADHQAAAGRADPPPAAQGARRPGQRAASASPASASHPWSTRWCRTPTARSAGVNAVTGKGRHTSSSAIALPLPGDSGWLIDTPGIRGFGLGHVTVDRVVEAFGDLAEGTAACPPGCDHLSDRLRTRRMGGRSTTRCPGSSRCAACSAPASPPTRNCGRGPGRCRSLPDDHPMILTGRSPRVGSRKGPEITPPPERRSGGGLTGPPLGRCSCPGTPAPAGARAGSRSGRPR